MEAPNLMKTRKAARPSGVISKLLKLRKKNDSVKLAGARP